MRVAVLKSGEPHTAKPVTALLNCLALLHAFEFKPGDDVAERASPRHQILRLEHIPGPAVQPGKRLAENADRAVRRLKKSRRHVENRGFSASRGTHDAHKFTGSDGEIDIPDRGVVRLLLSVAGNKGAGEIRDFYRGRIGFRCIHFL